MPPADQQSAATPSAPEATASRQALTEVATSVASPVVQMGFEAEVDLREDSGAAVVQANRSLTLTKDSQAAAVEPKRQSFDSSTPIGHAPFQWPVPTGPTSAEMIDASDPEIERQPAPEFESDSPAWPLELAESPVRAMPDLSTPPPADVEEITPMSPFPDVAGQSTPVTAETAQTDRPRLANWSWPGFAVFGFCTVIAIFWYRRGAT